MTYKVIRPFKDLTDPDKHDYAFDETYPRAGQFYCYLNLESTKTGYVKA